MNPMGRSIPVNPEMVKNEITILNVKIGMQREKLLAIKNHWDMTRRLVTFAVRGIVGCPEKETPGVVALWSTTSNDMEKVETDICRLAIMELEKDLNVAEFMLAEAEKSKTGLITN